MPDHIHLFVSAPPNLNLSVVVNLPAHRAGLAGAFPVKRNIIDNTKYLWA